MLDDAGAADIGERRRLAGRQSNTGPHLPALTEHGSAPGRIGRTRLSPSAATLLAVGVLGTDRTCLRIGQKRNSSKSELKAVVKHE